MADDDATSAINDAPLPDDDANAAINDAPLPDTPKRGTVRLELLRAYWPEADKRINEGTIFDCDAVAAIDLVQAGIARKAV